MQIWSPAAPSSFAGLEQSKENDEVVMHRESKQQQPVSQHLTRRFVEGASRNRLKLLKKKLEAARERPPFIVTSWKPQDPNSVAPPDPRQPVGSVGSGAGALQTSFFLAAAGGGRFKPRARTASPRRRQPAASSVLPHHLYNDFIQLPQSGTYRHMDVVFRSGEARNQLPSPSFHDCFNTTRFILQITLLSRRGLISCQNCAAASKTSTNPSEQVPREEAAVQHLQSPQTPWPSIG